MQFNETPKSQPEVGFKAGIGWCVWLGEEMIAAGFADQSIACAWVASIDVVERD